MGEINLDKYPAVLLEIVETVRELLIAAGADPAKAHDIAFAAAEKVRHRWGGTTPYICKGVDFELDARDRELWRRYNGTNRLALCREFEITEQRFYQIMRRMNEEDIARRQMRLFG
jgi:Mor family transcriptional regulator